MKRKVVDVSRLAPIAFGHRDPLWWGVMLLIAIEGTMLTLVTIAYYYVGDRTTPFPPTHMGRDVAWIATGELAAWLLSIYPAHRASAAAVAGDLKRMRRNLIIATVLGAIGCAIRVWIFHRLPFRWDAHAYGSVVWTLLGLQWVHGLTGVGENIVYIVLLFTGPVEDKHRVDVEAMTPLWYFVVAGTTLAWAVVFLQILLRGPT